MGADIPVRAGLILERDRELARIEGLLAATRSGDGGLLLISGPAGIGKTALIREGSRRARSAGIQVLSARCSELEAGFSFGVARQLFEPLLAAASQAERETLLTGAAHRAVGALEGQEGARVPILSAPAFAAIHGLYWLAVNASRSAPLLLLIDDVQDADPASMEFILYLAARLQELPVGLAASRRSGEDGATADRLARLEQLAGSSVLYPEALTLAGTTDVLAQAYRQPPGSRFATTCQAATGGNPFLLHELATSLRAEGTGPGDEAADQVAGLSPVSIARSVTLRLARLGEVPARLARATAILGDGTQLRHAAELAGAPQAEAAVAADQLAAIGVLEAGTPLRFRHPIVRAAVHDGILAAERGVRHAQAARLLAVAGADVEEVCAHLLACEPGGMAESAELLQVAASRAMARGAPHSAVAYLRRALAESAHDTRRAMALYALGRAEVMTFDAQAIPHLHSALDLAAGKTLRSQIAVDLAQLLVLAGQLEASRAVIQAEVDRQLGGTADSGEDTSPAAVRLRTCWAWLAVNDPQKVGEFDRRLPELLGIARGAAPEQRVLAGFLAEVIANRGDRSGLALELLEHALDQDQLLEYVDSDHLFVGAALFAVERLAPPARTNALAEQLLAQSRARGSVVGVAIGTSLRIAVRTSQGDLRGAEADIRALLEAAPEHGLAGTTLYWGADALIERPGLADVTALLSQMQFGSDGAQTFSDGLIRELRGRIALAAGDLATAGTELRAAAEYDQEQHRLTPNGLRWSYDLALATAAKDRAKGLQLAEAQLADATRLGLPEHTGIALRTLGVIEGGEPGLAHLREAESLLRGSVRRLEYARALVELGAALRRANQRAAARQPLREGLDLADRCGATRLAERARRELLATGARPRRAMLTGLDSLTASERRVAELAASGLSNPEIAQALFVTLNTVEGHLRHVYGKLSVGSRQQLPAVLSSAAPHLPAQATAP